MLFSKKARVILDTNFLLLPGDGFDVFTAIYDAMNEPYKLCVLEKTYHELESIIQGTTKTKQKGKSKFYAKLGYVMAKQKRLTVLHKGQKALSVDDQLVNAADKHTYVATLDKALQKRILDAGGKVITKGKGDQVKILER
jgi:rRNA-processing protein FCF1